MCNIMKQKQILILILICVVSVGVVGWFLQRVRRAPVFVDASEYVPASTFGVFIYANNEARFYPFQLLAQQGGVQDALGGVRFELIGSDPQTVSVHFASDVVLPYELTTLSAAQYEFPGVLVYTGK